MRAQLSKPTKMSTSLGQAFRARTKKKLWSKAAAIGAKNAPDGGAAFAFTLPFGRKDPE